MKVWTGYHPYIGRFQGEAAVAQYKNSLVAVNPNDDPHNEFTEGAYIGTKMFLAAVQKVADKNQKLTRASLQAALNSNTFDFGLTSAPLSYSGGALPPIAHSALDMFQENGSPFNSWVYSGAGWVAAPATGQDLAK